VGFYDAGWIAGVDQGFGDMLHGVGFGLRLGSPSLLGSTVIRIDLAFPLREPDGADYSPSLSIATNQVFSFFGNQSALSTR
jgi:outer membrane translocation and assembly module TamA